MAAISFVTALRMRFTARSILDRKGMNLAPKRRSSCVLPLRIPSSRIILLMRSAVIRSSFAINYASGFQ